MGAALKAAALIVSIISGAWKLMDFLGNVDFIKTVLNSPNHWVWDWIRRGIGSLLDWGWVLTLPVAIAMQWGDGLGRLKERFERAIGSVVQEPKTDSVDAPVPSGDPLGVSDSLQVDLQATSPEFTFRPEARIGSIILFASQVFDENAGHKGSALLTNVLRSVNGRLATTPEFHKGGKFLGRLELGLATRTNEMHYGSECGWALISGGPVEPKIDYRWGDKLEHRESMRHPQGEFVATVEIKAWEKFTERTVRYKIGERLLELVAS